jgi:hypothetical protein
MARCSRASTRTQPTSSSAGNGVEASGSPGQVPPTPTSSSMKWSGTGGQVSKLKAYGPEYFTRMTSACADVNS